MYSNKKNTEIPTLKQVTAEDELSGLGKAKLLQIIQFKNSYKQTTIC